MFLQRSYNISLPHKKIPDGLCQLAKRLAGPAMPCGEEFQPEAAIVNYFGLGVAYNLTSLKTWHGFHHATDILNPV